MAPNGFRVLVLRYGDEVPEGDERTVSGLLLEQVEFADVLLLNKMDLLRSTGVCVQPGPCTCERVTQPGTRVSWQCFPDTCQATPGMC